MKTIIIISLMMAVTGCTTKKNVYSCPDESKTPGVKCAVVIEIPSE